MPVSLTQFAVKESTLGVTAIFTDEDGSAVTPATIKWSLYSEAGAPINSRENVEISPTASTVTIVLSGNDLRILDEKNEKEKRRLVIAATYTSSLGSNLPLRESAEFWVLNTDQDVA